MQSLFQVLQTESPPPQMDHHPVQLGDLSWYLMFRTFKSFVDYYLNLNFVLFKTNIKCSAFTEKFLQIDWNNRFDSFSTYAYSWCVILVQAPKQIELNMQKLHQCTILKLLNFLLPRPLFECCSSEITSTKSVHWISAWQDLFGIQIPNIYIDLGRIVVSPW